MKQNSEIRITEALPPPEMADSAVSTGISKAHMGLTKTAMLAILAGAFIAFGAIFSTVVSAGSTLPFGLSRLLSGLTFSLGLILVVVGGAELFTGNNLMIMGWANRKISTSGVLRNWSIVYLGNMLGAFSMVLFIWLSGHPSSGDGAVAERIVQIAAHKCTYTGLQAFTLGILCNILVCLAIWLCYSSRTVQGRILAIVFPITAFVAAGFEHSVANMYFIPMGLVVKDWSDPAVLGFLNSSPELFNELTWGNFLIKNLLPVSLGNIVGGSLFVGMAYWFIYSSKWNKHTNT